MSANAQDSNSPLTRHSVVLAAQSDDPAARSQAIEAITAAYWKPVYKYVRMKRNMGTEDAADFTQDFFSLLRTCADRL